MARGSFPMAMTGIIAFLLVPFSMHFIHPESALPEKYMSEYAHGSLCQAEMKTLAWKG